MWVRGLKLAKFPIHFKAIRVAPYVGAWIETSLWLSERTAARSHPMWVRGLKQ